MRWHLAMIAAMVWLAMDCLAAERTDPLDLLIDRYYLARGEGDPASAPDSIYDPAFLLDWRQAEEVTTSDDDFADWTIFGREPTWRDLQAIAENLQRLAKSKRGEIAKNDFPPGEDGAVIVNLVEAATATGAVFGRVSVSQDMWPAWHDEDEISWFAPDGSLRWYSAPWPWVIHHRQPFIGLWTPSPYYENPWIFTLSDTSDGRQVYTWRNIWPRTDNALGFLASTASTHFSVAYDSDIGWRGGLDISRPWSAISWSRGSNSDSSIGNHNRHFGVSLDFHAVSRLPFDTTLWLWRGPNMPTTVIRRSPSESFTGSGLLNANANRSRGPIRPHPAPNYWLGEAVANGSVRALASGDDLIFIHTGSSRFIIQGNEIRDLMQPAPAAETMILHNSSGVRLIYIPPDGSQPIVGRGIIVLPR